MNHLTNVMVSGGTAQTARADERQVQNSAGGYTFTVSPLDRIKRFLILGSDASFYNGASDLTLENAQSIVDYVKTNEPGDVCRLIDLIVEISKGGRAPKQSPGLFALALVISQTTSDTVKSYGYTELPKVARTGSTLLEFAGYLSQFQRFGMGARKAIGRWYGAREIDNLAYQLAKYRSRSGFTHADLLRLSKQVKSDGDPALASLLNWTVGKPYDQSALPKVIQGLEKAKTARVVDLPEIIEKYGLSWEMLPSEALSTPMVWGGLIRSDNLPLGALVRNLGRMTAIGVFDGEGIREKVLSRLADPDEIKRSRLHPLNLLVAYKTYLSGQGLQGSLRWVPESKVAAALNNAIYLAYGNVDPSKSRMMYALDVSGSMSWSNVAGAPITPMEAEAMLALVTANVEERCHIVGFSRSIVPVPIKPGMKLQEALGIMQLIPMGGTDIAQPILHALDEGLEIDTFVVVTDNETWAGHIHPHEALKKYRAATGINAKLIVLATTATRFSIADPSDPQMLDIAGFDLSTPQIISEFARGL